MMMLAFLIVIAVIALVIGSLVIWAAEERR